MATRSSEYRQATQRRIDAQQAIVETLVPGSQQHRLATRVLLALQDSLHLLLEVDALMNAAGKPQGKAAE